MTAVVLVQELQAQPGVGQGADDRGGAGAWCVLDDRVAPGSSGAARFGHPR
ncbi:hypothetical protein ACWDKQ_08895 [Saccharopolyspora sp. NPDC000995]